MNATLTRNVRHVTTLYEQCHSPIKRTRVYNFNQWSGWPAIIKQCHVLQCKSLSKIRDESEKSEWRSRHCMLCWLKASNSCFERHNFPISTLTFEMWIWNCICMWNKRYNQKMSCKKTYRMQTFPVRKNEWLRLIFSKLFWSFTQEKIQKRIDKS